MGMKFISREINFLAEGPKSYMSAIAVLHFLDKYLLYTQCQEPLAQQTFTCICCEPKQVKLTGTLLVLEFQ